MLIGARFLPWPVVSYFMGDCPLVAAASIVAVCRGHGGRGQDGRSRQMHRRLADQGRNHVFISGEESTHQQVANHVFIGGESTHQQVAEHPPQPPVRSDGRRTAARRGQQWPLRAGKPPRTIKALLNLRRGGNRRGSRCADSEHRRRAWVGCSARNNPCLAATQLPTGSRRFNDTAARASRDWGSGPSGGRTLRVTPVSANCCCCCRLRANTLPSQQQSPLARRRFHR